MLMPQLLPTAQHPHGSERLPLYPYPSSWLQSSTGHQIHLMREEQTCLLSEKRGTPGQCSGKNDPLPRSPNSSASTGVNAETITSTPARCKRRTSSSSQSPPLGRGAIAKRTPPIFIQNGFTKKNQTAFLTTTVLVNRLIYMRRFCQVLP